MNLLNKKMEVYFGSNRIVNQPKIITDGYYKDFGYGFYCTNFEKQAMRWSLTKKNNHIVNVYMYTENLDLNCKAFEQMSDEWLDFVVSSRRGITHTYDIVEGPMADDTIWNYVDDFARGLITRAAFWEVFSCTEEALKCLFYQRSYNL